MPSKREAIVARANSLVGCGYIYGATGWICTQSHLDQQAKQYPMYAEQIYRYGPRWMGKPCYDCAQLTRDVAARVGVTLPSGATSQWRAGGVWKEKDVIDTLPNEAGIFLFTMTDGRMTHTGVSVGGGMEVDARGHAYGVVKRAISGTSYTHWARLAIDYDAPAGELNPPPVGETRRTLKSGMSGDDVRALQTQLLTLGYSLAPYGADGSFGKTTKSAVERFQKEHGLTADGIVGASTWAALDAAEPGEDEEPAALTRLCLTGLPLAALVQASEDAKQVLFSDRMRLEMTKEAYDALKNAIDDEA